MTLKYDPFNPANRDNPYPVYKAMREEAPLFKDDEYGEIFVSRHADILPILRDAERFSSDSTNVAPELIAMRTGDAPDNAQLGGFLGGKVMLFSDPPDHTRLRRLASHAFTPKAVDSWRPRVRALVDDMLSGVGPGDEFDVMETLARPLPVFVIAEILGVPVEDRDKFAEWSVHLARMIDPETNLGDGDFMKAMQAAMEFVQYFNGLIEERRAAPRDDVVSVLVAAEEEGDRLSHEELLANLILLLVAGHETTSNLIGNGTLALCTFPDARDEFAADPDGLAKTAIDEFLRYDSPVQFTVRTAMCETEIGGLALAKGHQAILMLAGANRDPAAFDNAEGLTLDRTPNHHVAFSSGVHFCLGSMLARMEGQEVFPALIKRLPKLERSADLVYRPNMTLRGLAELRVIG
ncbi:MAG TPA: cytochrome P450 [Acidimicrobiales bacterium]|nr:cytochrome P450 [Acidimicrobiales bacterium]